MMAAIGVIYGIAQHTDNPDKVFLASLAVPFAYIWLFNALHRWQVQRDLIKQQAFQLVPHVIALNAEGLHIQRAGATFFYPHTLIQAVTRVADISCLHIDAYNAIPIPDQAFANESERQEFLAQITASGAQNVRTPTFTQAETAQALHAPHSLSSATSNFLTNIKATARAICLLRVNTSDYAATLGQFLLYTLLNVGLHFAEDFFSVGPSGHFLVLSLPSQLYSIPILMMAAWALARLGKHGNAALTLAVGFSAVFFAFGLFRLPLEFAAEQGWLSGKASYYAHQGMLVWYVLIVAFMAAHMLNMSVLRRLAALFVAAGLVGFPLSSGMYYRDPLWIESHEDKPDPFEAFLKEENFYRQHELLDKALNALQPGDPNRVNMFFVGAAGDSEQDVFMKEIQSVNNLFSQRFGTAGHSVTLINNMKTLSTQPIASATALDATFNRLAKVMNKDKDILFLYLTSHGSRDEGFVMDFNPLELNYLSPQTLREMLDHAGIKHRVIVVSACYSGTFIEPLKDDNTLVITAAAADRTSFGCSNELDYTYFGEAYFKQALNQTDSFIDAFDTAKQIVTAREKAEGEKPSLPQISVGKYIPNVLSQWQAQRHAASE